MCQLIYTKCKEHLTQRRKSLFIVWLRKNRIMGSACTAQIHEVWKLHQPRAKCWFGCTTGHHARQSTLIWRFSFLLKIYLAGELSTKEVVFCFLKKSLFSYWVYPSEGFPLHVNHLPCSLHTPHCVNPKPNHNPNTVSLTLMITHIPNLQKHPDSHCTSARGGFIPLPSCLLIFVYIWVLKTFVI